MTAVGDWARALNSHHSVHCLFLDFARAFDLMPHERHLLKLQLFGVGGVLLNWYKCFLTTCRQRINGSFSSWLPMISGVPLLYLSGNL